MWHYDHISKLKKWAPKWHRFFSLYVENSTKKKLITLNKRFSYTNIETTNAPIATLERTKKSQKPNESIRVFKPGKYFPNYGTL